MSSTFLQRVRGLRAEMTAIALLLPLAIALGFVLTRFPMGDGQPTATDFSAATPATPTPATQTVTLEIKGPSGTATSTVPVAGETTVAELLAHATRTANLSLDIKDYGGTLGIFVEGMNGVRNDTKRGWYWTLYVNGTKSSLGASSARVRQGDRVTWSFEPMTKE